MRLTVKRAGRGNYKPFVLPVSGVTGLAPGDLLVISGTDYYRVTNVEYDHPITKRTWWRVWLGR